MTSLEKLRKEIDEIDKKIIVELVKRKEVIEKIVKFKKKHAIPIENINREQIVIQNAIVLGSKHGLRKEFVKEIFELIIKESKKIQRKN